MLSWFLMTMNGCRDKRPRWLMVVMLMVGPVEAQWTVMTGYW
jgi:hypothetical protein